jgi:8-oxo-dGTP pyrophosphatase MutT (NUDIX family)
MDRTGLQRLLENYHTDNPEEMGFKPRMLDLLARYPDCFERSCIPPGHFTGSCLVLGYKGEKTLMTHHQILDRWLQLGGHADGNPDILDVALREGEEESGLTGIRALLPGIFNIDIHDIPANPKKGEAAHQHYDVQFLLYTPQEEFTVSTESRDLQWLTYETAISRAVDPGLKRLLGKWNKLQQDGTLATLIAQSAEA